MGRKMKAKLIAFLMAILSLFIFAGCSMGESLDEVLETRDLNPRITYYANGGAFESNSAVKQLYYPIGAKALDIGNANIKIASGSVSITREGFELVGWFEVEENQIIDKEKGLCELGDEWDFTTQLQEGDDIILAAKWRALVGLQVVMVCDEGETVAVGAKVENEATLKGETFKNGDVIGEIAYDSKETISSSATPNARLFTVKDKTHTFYSYYWDKECTQEISWPIKRGEEQQTIYAKYIKGDWIWVKTAEDVYKMFNATTKNYWICNDINYTKADKLLGMTSFSGEIRGNGYTISGLKFDNVLKQGNKFSIFGVIKGTAKITNLNLTNVSVYVKLRNQIHAQVYLVFSSKAEEATISNVAISMAETDGFIVDCPDTSFVDNINGTGSVAYVNCLYGGYDADAEYLTESGGTGFTVNGNPEEFITVNII